VRDVYNEYDVMSSQVCRFVDRAFCLRVKRERRLSLCPRVDQMGGVGRCATKGPRRLQDARAQSHREKGVVSNHDAIDRFYCQSSRRGYGCARSEVSTRVRGGDGHPPDKDDARHVRQQTGRLLHEYNIMVYNESEYYQVIDCEQASVQ